MEKFNRPVFRRKDVLSQTVQDYWEKAKSKASSLDDQVNLTGVSQTVGAYLRQRDKTAFRRKWAGRGISLLGASILLSSCAISIFSTTGLYTAGLGIGLLVSGLALSSWKPRLKDTTEALIAAHKYDNILNTARLALEMDISPDRAEQILQELVRKGIAEIELDHKTPDSSISYRIKGL